MSFERLEAAARAVDAARRILFVTGAGISADSGLPTYRGIGGLYGERDTDDGIPIEEALSATWFRRDPEVTWRYIRQIEEACRGAKPNEAHRAIVALERSEREIWVLTQNVDGLHRAAGSQKLIEIHGNVHELSCTRCAHEQKVEDYAELPALPALPHCPVCGAIVRPKVVLFEEMLPGPAVHSLQEQLERGFDLVVSIGTSSLFPYIIQPLILAKEAGKSTIEINPGHTTVSEFVDVHLQMGAAVAMAELMSRLGAAS